MLLPFRYVRKKLLTYLKQKEFCRFSRLYFVKHTHTLFVPSAFEISVKPALYYELCKLYTNDARTKGENVSIVMLTGECRGIRLTAHYRSYSLYSVCGKRNADTRTADYYTALRVATDYRACNRFSKNGVVASVG